ncbi:hypothetical protein CUMW_153160, partial [Citrus unshiu]
AAAAPLLLDFHCCRPLLLDFHCCRLSFLDVTAAFALLLSSFNHRRLASHLSVRRCYRFYAVTSTSAQPATVPLPPRSRTISFSSLFWQKMLRDRMLILASTRERWEKNEAVDGY